jgi:hypothetical protein
MKCVVVPLQKDHLPYLASQMSAEDRAECAAMGFGPYRALRLGFDRSVASWCGLKLPENRPLGAFGVMPVDGLLGEMGAPWFLSTPELRRYPVMFLKECAESLRKVHDIFPVLVEMVDARHKRGIKWVKWLGFELTGPVKWGPLGMDFYRAERRRD